MARKALGEAALAVVRAIDECWPGGPVLVACSGGSDSTALVLGAAVVAARRGTALRAVVVDHGLQPTSAAIADEVVGRLAARGVPARARRVSVDLTAGLGLEAAARAARYEALAAEAAPDETVLLGHTRDDQAETVLLGLARGSGTRSLAGMPAARGPFLRPLLGIGSATTTQACREFGVEWVEDPHNAEARFARARIRHTVLPVLEAELGPGFAEALARTAALARQDADTLDELAADALAGAREGDDLRLDPAWTGLPALRARVLRRWLLDRGAGEVTKAHLDAVTELVIGWRGQRWIDLPGLRVARRAGVLVAAPPPAG